jgi:hypothetical protein
VVSVPSLDDFLPVESPRGRGVSALIAGFFVLSLRPGGTIAWVSLDAAVLPPWMFSSILFAVAPPRRAFGTGLIATLRFRSFLGLHRSPLMRMRGGSCHSRFEIH